jgi:hypothetical protein
VHSEIGDAGDLPLIAQTPCRPGPISAISGSFGAANDVDLYKIRIDSPAAFSASTCAASGIDTILSLFDSNGFGVIYNDDACSSQSQLTGSLVPGVTNAGVYYLAVAPSTRRPNSTGGLIFPTTLLGQHGPTGPGGALPVSSWSGSSILTGGYAVTLVGCSTACAAVAINYGSGAGGGAGIPSLTTPCVPQLGSSLGLTYVNNNAGSAAILMIGLERGALPFFHGQFLVSPLLIAITAPASAGTHQLGPFNIPNMLTLAGSKIDWQVLTIGVATSMTFPHGITLTNGVEWMLGI